MIFRPMVYLISIIGLSVALMAAGIVLERFAGISLPGSVSIVVVPMIAAMIEGQGHVSRTGEAPEKGAMWKAAFVMTMINVVVSALFMIGAAAVFGFNVMPLYVEVGGGFILVAAIGVGLLYLLMSRVGYGMGVKNQLKVRKSGQ